jgi:hypothetical protein
MTMNHHPNSIEISWKRMTPSSSPLSKRVLLPLTAETTIVLPHELVTLHDHDCLLTILQFLSWEDLNLFSLASRGCYTMRSHASLDQTRSGTIHLGHGVGNAKALMDKARTHHWAGSFRGNRTHLRLSNLTYLSSDIEPIDEAFIDTISPLQQVTSLDCSMVPPPPPPPSVHCADTDEEGLRQNNNNQPRRSWFLSRYEDYVDKGFAQGLTLSLLVPNLQSIDMSYLPLTMIGVAWLTENNPHLKVIRWNHSLIWPVSNDSEHHLEALKYLKEVYLDEARILFCQDNLNEESLWNSLLDHIHGLERVSLLGTRWYRKGKLAELSQGYLVKFVRGTPSLKWFRSDLSPANVDLLRKERPQVMFVSSS